MNLDHVLQTLNTEGVRMTSVRHEIISHIIHAEHPLSAPEIQKSIRFKQVNKTTIYRFLDVLLEKKIIKKVFITPELVKYESNFLPHHHHVTCTKCGVVDEVMSPQLEEVIDKLEKDVSRYKINNHVVEFYGVCKTCQ